MSNLCLFQIFLQNTYLLLKTATVLHLAPHTLTSDSFKLLVIDYWIEKPNKTKAVSTAFLTLKAECHSLPALTGKCRRGLTKDSDNATNSSVGGSITRESYFLDCKGYLLEDIQLLSKVLHFYFFFLSQNDGFSKPCTFCFCKMM